MAQITIQLNTQDPNDLTILGNLLSGSASPSSKATSPASPGESKTASTASSGDSTDSKPEKPKAKRTRKPKAKDSTTATTASSAKAVADQPRSDSDSAPPADADLAKETRTAMLAAARLTKDSALILGILNEVAGVKKLEKADPATYAELKKRFEAEVEAAEICGEGA